MLGFGSQVFGPLVKVAVLRRKSRLPLANPFKKRRCKGKPGSPGLNLSGGWTLLFSVSPSFKLNLPKGTSSSHGKPLIASIQKKHWDPKAPQKDLVQILRFF